MGENCDTVPDEFRHGYEAVSVVRHLFAPTPPSHHRVAVRGAIAWSQGFCPLKASHDTLACQFTNVPVGLSFHAHTCSV
jgi:hypothetical protein